MTSYPPRKSLPGQTEFDFYHSETTGITSYISRGATNLPILFDEGSDQKAVDSLYSLPTDTFLETDGSRILIMGVLHQQVRWTPNKPGMAQIEPYQEFTLLGWRVEKEKK